MAIDLKNKANTLAPNDEYPNGSILDKIQGVQQGTPVNRSVYSDAHQLLQMMLEISEVRSNGSPDNNLQGYQLLEALNQNIYRISNPTPIAQNITTGLGTSLTRKNFAFGGGFFIAAYNTSDVAGSGNQLWRSVDGINFTQSTVNYDVTNFTGYDLQFDCITFADGNWWAIGRSNDFFGNNGQVVILKSTDNGATFDEIPLSGYDMSTNPDYVLCSASPDSFVFASVKTPDELAVFRYNETLGTIVATSVLTTGTGFLAKDITCLNGNFVLVGSNTTDTTKKIYSSIDDGLNFNFTNIATPANVDNNSFEAITSVDFFANNGQTNNQVAYIAMAGADIFKIARISNTTVILNHRDTNNTPYNSVAFGNGKVVAYSPSNVADKNMLIGNGLTAKEGNYEVGIESMIGVYYGNGRFVMPFGNGGINVTML